MIFVTVGTDHHPFHRVFDWLAEARSAGLISPDESIVAQYGYTERVWENIDAHKFLTFEQMIKFFQQADLIITHGSSTALLALHYGKLPLVIPRRKHMGEHIDDHQHDFVMQTRGVLPLKIINSRAEFISILSHRESLNDIPDGFEVGGESAVAKFEKFFTELVGQ